MTQPTAIPKSSRGLLLTIISLAIGTGLILLLVLFLIDVVFGWTTNAKQFFATIAIVVLIGSWVFAALGAWLRWNGTRYEMDEKAIIVHTKTMFFESTRTEFFYATLSGAHMRKTFLSKFGDYGDIVLADSNGNKLVTLAAIANPAKRFEEISAHIKR